MKKLRLEEMTELLRELRAEVEWKPVEPPVPGPVSLLHQRGEGFELAVIRAYSRGEPSREVVRKFIDRSLHDGTAGKVVPPLVLTVVVGALDALDEPLPFRLAVADRGVLTKLALGTPARLKPAVWEISSGLSLPRMDVTKRFVPMPAR